MSTGLKAFIDSGDSGQTGSTIQIKRLGIRKACQGGPNVCMAECKYVYYHLQCCYQFSSHHTDRK